MLMYIDLILNIDVLYFTRMFKLIIFLFGYKIYNSFSNFSMFLYVYELFVKFLQDVMISSLFTVNSLAKYGWFYRLFGFVVYNLWYPSLIWDL